jgi:hypothetical protein
MTVLAFGNANRVEEQPHQAFCRTSAKRENRLIAFWTESSKPQNYEGVHGSNTSKAQKGGSIVLTTGMLGSDQSFRRFRAVACTSGV